MSELTIFKASAGSGKTYQLVLEYLKLIVKNPYDYKHILAVTFTIKATAEMKQRIVRDLHKVATGADSNLIETLEIQTNLSTAKVSQNAQKALSLILHDYDHFSINTIDSFFQGVLRSFARDVGLYGAYEVDLDHDALLMEATDRLLDTIEDDVELRNWLLEMTEDQLADGKSWQIKSKILQLGRNIDNINLQEYIHANVDIEVERATLKQLKSSVFKMKQSFELRQREIGKKALQIIQNSGLQLTDYSGGSRAFVNYFKYCVDSDKRANQPSNTVLNAVDTVEKWYAKKAEETTKTKIIDSYNNGLNDCLKAALELIDQDFKKYNTAIHILQNLHALGVISILVAQIREIGKERNTMLLSEGNQILHKIIDDNDTPFIYEKTGNFYQHFMIDEFQDTSSNQWDNFKPLIHNSISQEQNYNMIVGDVKQSIYRWRNSDWRLLKEKVKADLYPFPIEEKELANNWRSSFEVVQFNNLFFQKTSLEIQAYLNTSFEKNDQFLKKNKGVDHIIAEIYSDVAQIPQKTDLNGFVQLKFVENQRGADAKYAELVFDSLISDVEKLQVNGAQAKDIAILVRKKSQGNEIAEALLNKRKTDAVEGCVYDVISDDSLTLEGSIAVRFVILFFQYLMNTKDALRQKSLIHYYGKYILSKLEAAGTLPPKVLYNNESNQLFGAHEDDKSFFSTSIANDYFPFFNEDDASVIIDNWLNLPPLQLVDEIETIYGLRWLDGEQANLQAFKDAIHQFVQRETISLQKLVDWWEEKGNRLSIQTNSDRNAIRIMTIHKSKGLEFEHVLIPFCDWDFTTKTNSLIWCSTRQSSYNQFPILPVAFNESLVDSDFFEDYLEELLFSYIDNINLLYVAFTRAVSSLFIYSEKKNDIKDLKQVSKLLNKIIPEIKNEAEEIEMQNEEDNIFVVGALHEQSQTQNIDNSIQLSTSIKLNRTIQDALMIKKNYEGMLEESDSSLLKLNRGKIIHELLAEIEHKSDLEEAIQRVVNKGIVALDESDLLKEKAAELLANREVENWFNGTYTVLNERSVINDQQQLFRPDRVMVNDRFAIVVDYKNSETVKETHKKQVRNYMSILQNIGYTQIDGFVWYLKSDEIVKVDA